MDRKLKQRLVVAIIIVALVVIFLPMLFSGRADKEMSATSAVPPAPEQPSLEQKLKPTTMLVPQETISEDQEALDDEAASQDMSILSQDEENSGKTQPQETENQEQENSDQSMILEQNEQTPTVQQESQSTSVIKTEKETLQPITPTVQMSSPVPAKMSLDQHPVSKAKMVSQKVSTHKTTSRKVPSRTNNRLSEKKRIAEAKSYSRAWIVQLGSFTQTQNANALIKRLRDNGFRAFGYRKIRADSVTNRVYVGPFSKVDDAKKMRDKLKSAMNVKGIVVKFSPVDVD